MSVFELDTSELDDLQAALEEYEGHAGRMIDEVLHGEGATVIKEKIAALIPESGRTWRGKGASASSAMPGRFSQDNETLGVTIAARGKYGYLYFPDDGSNTMKHAGGQHFFQAGGEEASGEVVELIIGKLTEGL